MNILSKVTWKSLTKNKTRTGVTVLAVVLATATLTAVLTLGISLQNYLVRDTVYRTGDYYTMFYYATDAQKQDLLRNEKAASVADYQALGFFIPEGTPSNWSSFILAAGNKAFFETMPVHLVEGRLPKNSHEIVIPDCRQETLEYFGYSATVGSEITLELSTIFDDSQGLGSYHNAMADYPAPIPERTVTKTYTIVGIVHENPFSQDDGAVSPNLSTLLTAADGSQGDPIWHWLYVKTNNVRDVRSAFTDTAYGLYRESNSALLALYGMSSYGQNYTTWIFSACAALIVIILAASVCPIYTAFSISVSERTKQFGLLSSVGATKKQLRKSVLFEALFVCAAGIPLGLLLGFGGIAIAIRGLERYIANLFLHTAEHTAVYAVASPLVILAAAGVSSGMVFLSAWVPAKRAARVTPITAIHQDRDYQVRGKDAKLGRLSWKIWGFPGTMARKYYRVSRKKYRATVISLAISVALFLSATALSTQLHNVVNAIVPAENFDIVFRGSPEEMEAVRKLDSTSRSAYQDSWIYYSLWNEASLSPEFWEAKAAISRHFPDSYYAPDATHLYVQYLEDEVLRAYLIDACLDPAPYFAETDPAALVCETVYRTPYYPIGDAWTYDTFQIYPICENAQPAFLLSNVEYGALEQALPMEAGTGYWNSEFLLYEDVPLVKVWPMMELPGEEAGTLIMEPKEDQALYFEMVRDTDPQNTPVIHFYPYDINAKIRSEMPAVTTEDMTPRFHFGRRINLLPYGIAKPESMITVVLPLSKAPKADIYSPGLMLSTSNHRETKAYLDAIPDSEYIDYIEAEESGRSMVLLIDTFSYSFLILVSLICGAGVFNTVSTNLTLRRRDFGTLLSLGMKEKELRRMVASECVQYGMRSLLWGTSIGLAAGFGLSFAIPNSCSAAFPVPWLSITVAILAVFLIVFASMAYSLSKLRKESPMEAIRHENL